MQLVMGHHRVKHVQAVGCTESLSSKIWDYIDLSSVARPVLDKRTNLRLSPRGMLYPVQDTKP